MSGSSLHFVSFRMTALLVNGVRCGRSPRLTPPQIEGVIPKEAQRNEESSRE